MKIELKNFITNGQVTGFVAYFDVRLENGMLVRDLALKLPERHPGEAWLVLPALARDERRTVHFPPDLRNEIGRRAAAAFSAVSGKTLEYQPPRPKAVDAGIPTSGDGVHEANKPKMVKSEWMAQAEPDDAGLRRVLCAGGEETLAAAGI